MIWNSLVRPILFSLPPEPAHYFSMGCFAAATRFSLAARVCHKLYSVDDERLSTRLWGIPFPNPVGLAAGFDKNGHWFNQLPLLGFGHVEIGTITGQSQPGNDPPRLFRLPADRALINRMGFNNDGCEAASRRLDQSPASGLLGINIGRTKMVANENAAADYLKSFRKLYRHASYFAVNVSSPNTPGLRELQGRDELSSLLSQLIDARTELAAEDVAASKPILLKIAPDLTDSQLDDIVQIVNEINLDGVIATNTTIGRRGLSAPSELLDRIGSGGLSGKPLAARSRQVVRHLYRKSSGELTIVGVGGIMDGPDACRLIRYGASMVQVYTGFIYAGPGFVKSILTDLVEHMDRNHWTSVSQMVGVDA